MNYLNEADVDEVVSDGWRLANPAAFFSWTVPCNPVSFRVRGTFERQDARVSQNRVLHLVHRCVDLSARDIFSENVRQVTDIFTLRYLQRRNSLLIKYYFALGCMVNHLNFKVSRFLDNRVVRPNHFIIFEAGESL